MAGRPTPKIWRLSLKTFAQEKDLKELKEVSSSSSIAQEVSSESVEAPVAVAEVVETSVDSVASEKTESELSNGSSEEFHSEPIIINEQFDFDEFNAKLNDANLIDGEEIIYYCRNISSRPVCRRFR